MNICFLSTDMPTTVLIFLLVAEFEMVLFDSIKKNCLTNLFGKNKFAWLQISCFEFDTAICMRAVISRAPIIGTESITYKFDKKRHIQELQK